MKGHLSNAVYGTLDYLAYPLGMLAAAPIALRALGIDRYGIWMVATAAISTGAIVASGFGDANIRMVATQEATGNRDAVVKAVRTTLGIHIALGAHHGACGLHHCPLAHRSRRGRASRASR